MRKQFLFFLFFVSVSFTKAYSQSKGDTLTFSYNRSSYFLLKDFFLDSAAGKKPDTVLTSFRNWDPIRLSGEYEHLGNLGLDHCPIVFKPEPSFGLPFYSAGPFPLSRFRNENIRYFQTRRRFTGLEYFQGSKKTQSLLLTHTQNITPEWNFGFDFKRAGAEGFIARQKSNNTHFNAWQWFQSKSGRYKALAGFSGNNMRTQENGGVTQSFYYEASPELLPNSAEVLWSEAEARFMEREISISQFLKTGYLEAIQDSGDTVPKMKLHASGQFFHTIQYGTKYRVFKNGQAPDFFILNDSLTRDSLNLKLIQNEIGFQWFGERAGKPGFRRNRETKASMVYAFQPYYQNRIRSDFSNIVLHLNTEGVWLKKHSYGIRGWYNLSGTNREDLGIRAHWYVPLDSGSWYVGISMAHFAQKPDYQLIRFSGNRREWSNSFNQSQTEEGTFTLYGFPWNLRFSASIFNLRQFVYYGLGVYPVQIKNPVQVGVISARKEFQWWKIKFQTKLIYQESNSHEIPLPNWIVSQSVFFESGVFKAAGNFSVGFDFRWTSAYKGFNYWADGAIFYRNDSPSIGNYPITDFFMALQVKRARLFLKAEHFNKNLFGNYSYSAPYYTMQNMMFVLGISWNFYD